MKKKFYIESEIEFQDYSKLQKTFNNVTGEVFSRLSVLGFAGKDKSGNSLWFCKCQCGNITKNRLSHLSGGKTTSCGCLHREKVIETHMIHGHNRSVATSKTYRTWQGMLGRCRNPQNEKYKDYGGRGIKVCKRWQSFSNFLEDMGEKPNGLTLDRKNVDGGYCPENCRWSTQKEQQNNRRNNVRFIFNGKNQTLSEWGDESGINPDIIGNRIKCGWDVERAISTPVTCRTPPKKKI